MIGSNNFNFGKQRSEKTRKKISNALKGKKRPKEVKAKMSKTFFREGLIPWNKGKVYSEIYRKKFSESHLGQIPWNKGLMGTGGNKGKLKHQKLVNKVANFFKQQKLKVQVEKSIPITPFHCRIIDVFVNDKYCMEIGSCDKDKINELEENGFVVIHLPYSTLESENYDNLWKYTNSFI